MSGWESGVISIVWGVVSSVMGSKKAAEWRVDKG
jgi:hypothetical protein